MPKLVYDFAEGNKDMKELLGGKGANLAEMTNLGLPVPPGFTITTEACKVFLETGSVPAELADEIDHHVDVLQQKMGKKLGQADDPLLVSVRSGAAVSMPGMMETVLNVGLNDDSVNGLAHQSGNPRFAWDAYRRLIQMFGKTVLGMEGEVFEDAIEAAKQAKGTKNDLDLDADDLKALVENFKAAVQRAHRPGVPAGPAGADGPRDRGRLRLLELRARHPVPPPGADRHRPRHGGQHLLDGVRQPRHGLRHRRRLHPRPGQRPARRVRRLPAERAGRGRRRRHPQHGPAGRSRAASTRRRTTN